MSQEQAKFGDHGTKLIKATENVTGVSALPTPADLLQIAVSNNADLDKLEKLMDLQSKWEEREAKKKYVKAMTLFKSQAPQILKDKEADFPSKKGGRVKYSYAPLGSIARVIAASLAQFGLSHSWTTQQNGDVIVTCTITHEDGYSESTSLSAPADTSGTKNAIQSIGSTMTYLQKYTLMAITGLAASDQDDDGNSAGEPPAPLSSEQIKTMAKIISDKEIDTNKFLDYMKYDSVDEILASDYKKALKALAGAKGEKPNA